MTEILTESFCERCGTRYTFQSAAPARARMKRLKVLSKGLKNYVLSDETTLEEAFADARSDEERAVSSGQLDAFHQTFNFCMSCRQYTCGNCWNDPENRCLTCAPDLSREVLPAAFPDLDPMAGVAPPDMAHAPVNEDRAALLTASAWPEVDLPRDEGPETSDGAAATPLEIAAGTAAVAAGAAAVADDVSEPAAVTPLIEEAAMPPATAAGETAAAVGETAQPASDAPAPAAPEPTHPAPVPAEASELSVTSDRRAAAAAAQTSALLARFRPDKDLDKALEAYEQEAAAPPVARAAKAVPALAAAAAADAAGTAETQVTAEAAQPRETPAAEPAAAVEAPVAEPAAAVEPAAAAPVAERKDDRVEIPTWRIVAPDPGTSEPGAMPPVVTPSTTPSTPVWPPAASAGSADGEGLQWPSAPFLAAAPPAARARDAMWAASSLEVVEKAGGGVQSCVSCGLPLSATARFCRRCGSRQG